ncbi:MAG TPA: GDSL-type esterase/lipase family protein, partial [Verrucomicrobiaceae bacterium]
SALATDPPQSTVEAYEKQLREIVAKMKATGAKLILATTTPVPEGKLSPYRSNADVVRYNEAALRVAKDNGIAVDDLYSFVKPQESKIQRPENVHFMEDGYKALAEVVVKSIRAALK